MVYCGQVQCFSVSKHCGIFSPVYKTQSKVDVIQFVNV